MKNPDDITENDVKKDVMKYLEDQGIFHWKHWAGGKFDKNPNISDILGIYVVNVDDLVKAGIDKVGVFMGIELKRPGKKPTEGQMEWGKEVKKNHGIWFWVDCRESVVKFFNNINRNKKKEK